MLATIRNVRVIFYIVSFLFLSGCETVETTEPVAQDSQIPDYLSSQCLSDSEMEQLRHEANAGNADSQFQIGEWAMTACGGRDTVKAAEWYKRSATQGYDKAQYRLGNMYLHGAGVAKDIEHAEAWYRAAATQGHVNAMRAIGDIYYNRKNLQRDLDEAEKWYRLAVDAGDVYSRSKLDLLKRKQDEQVNLAKQLDEDHKQQQKEAQQYAQKAKAQFQSIHLSIVESQKSKRVRAEIRDKLTTMPEPKELPKVKEASGIFDLILVPIEMGPYLPLGIFLGDGSGPLPSEEEWAKIKKASTQLTSLLVDEDVEWNLQTQLLDVANKQQAFGLLKTSLSDAPHAFHQLHIEVEEIGFFKLPGDYRRARFWFSATAMLVEGNQKSTHKRFCYATQRAMPLSSWTGKERFMQELNAAYRNVSNQILMDLIGLAPDPDANQPWSKTALACLTDNNKPRTF